MAKELLCKDSVSERLTMQTQILKVGGLVSLKLNVRVYPFTGLTYFPFW